MHIHVIFLRNLQERETSFFVKEKRNVMLICSIKSFLSINSFNLELLVELINLVVIEYVHYEYRFFLVQEKSIENVAAFLKSLSII